MNTFCEYKVIAAHLADVARWAYRKGWAPGTSTNYSARLSEQAAPAFCAITSSGTDKETIGEDQILVIDRNGQAVDNRGLKPSAEAPLHLMLYHSVGAGAVLHTHSLAAVLVSRLASQAGHLTLTGWELLKGLHGIHTHDCKVKLPVFPNSQDMCALAADVKTALTLYPLCYAFLLDGHGLYVWGKDLGEAKRHLEVFEVLFQYELETRNYGHPARARQEDSPDRSGCHSPISW